MKVPNPRKLQSGTWFIQLRLGGESIPVSARTKKECIYHKAQLIKAEYKAGKRAREEKKPEGESAPTLGEAIDAYIEKRDAVLSPSTIRGYKIIRRTRFPGLMDRRITEITARDYQAACNDEVRYRNRSAKTVKNTWGFVASVIADATGGSAPNCPNKDRGVFPGHLVRHHVAALFGEEIARQRPPGAVSVAGFDEEVTESKFGLSDFAHSVAAPTRRFVTMGLSTLSSGRRSTGKEKAAEGLIAPDIGFLPLRPLRLQSL